MIDVPVYVWAIVLIIVFIWIVGWNPLKPFDFNQANEEASKTLNHLKQALAEFPDESRYYLENYLEELGSFFSMLVQNYPEHALTGRIRWIIMENMVTQFPSFKLMRPENVDDTLQPFRDQLEKVLHYFSQKNLEMATKVADQKFNWEQRDYFTL
jgi:hypothetical protein